MELRMLGPLEVCRADETVLLGGRKPRSVLALLLLDTGRPVSPESLIAGVWGADAAVNAKKTLQVYLSSLRGALESDRSMPKRILTQARGYRFTLRDDDSLDTRRFDLLAARGRAAVQAGDPERASRELTAALDLWRGDFLADLVLEPFWVTVGAEWQEKHMSVLESRIDADLARGVHHSLVAELRGLVATNPLRERLHEQLMVALYRGGRQAEALGVYAGVRRLLASELGLDPGPALRDMEQAVLRQDPKLDLPRTHRAVAGAVAPEPVKPEPVKPEPVKPEPVKPESIAAPGPGPLRSLCVPGTDWNASAFGTRRVSTAGVAACWLELDALDADLQELLVVLAVLGDHAQPRWVARLVSRPGDVQPAVQRLVAAGWLRPDGERPGPAFVGTLRRDAVVALLGVDRHARLAERAALAVAADGSATHRGRLAELLESTVQLQVLGGRGAEDDLARTATRAIGAHAWQLWHFGRVEAALDRMARAVLLTAMCSPAGVTGSEVAGLVESSLEAARGMYLIATAAPPPWGATAWPPPGSIADVGWPAPGAGADTVRRLLADSVGPVESGPILRVGLLDHLLGGAARIGPAPTESPDADRWRSLVDALPGMQSG